MASYNKITLVGNVGNDPQLKIVGDNRKVTDLSLAINEKGRNGQPDKTEWYRVTFWDSKAEIAANYVRKGNPILVEGRLSVRTYNDKDGRERYLLEVQGTELLLLGSKEDSQAPGVYQQNTQATPVSQVQPEASTPQPAPIPTPPALAKAGDEDDLPF